MIEIRWKASSKSSCFIISFAWEYLSPGCATTVWYNLSFFTGRCSVGISTVRSNRSRYSLISCLCISDIDTLCSGLFNISRDFLRPKTNDSLSIWSRISIGEFLSLRRFFADNPKSWEIKSSVNTLRVNLWLMSSTTLLIALVSSFFSYNLARCLKCPPYW